MRSDKERFIDIQEAIVNIERYLQRGKRDLKQMNCSRFGLFAICKLLAKLPAEYR